MFLYYPSVGLLIGILHRTSCSPVPSEPFPHSLPLDENDIYHLFWKYDEETIIFEVIVQTLGYVGFGISASGGMLNADIVIGWVKDGEATFNDRYTGQSRVMPTIDSGEPDWELLAASETETHTLLKFKRPRILCPDEDQPITEGTTRVIWSYNDNDPSSENSVPQHTHKGARSIHIIGGASKSAPLPQDSWSFDIKNDITIPTTLESKTAESVYWCRGALIPEMDTTHYITKTEPIKDGNEGVVHHMLVYLCSSDTQADFHTVNVHCDADNMPNRDTCQLILTGWAVGGGEFSFPDHVAYPIKGPAHVLLETHYDNPGLTSGIQDTSGMRIHVTPTARTYNSGFVLVGNMVHPSQLIPPKFPGFVTQGHCMAECLTKALVASNEDEIHVFAVLLHTHLIGVAVKVRHFRDGNELPLVEQDDNYDFNFQEVRHLPQEVIVKKGDDLIVECTYNTEELDDFTKGGLRTQEEMCLAFLSYYPDINLRSCETRITETTNYPYVTYTNKQWSNVNERRTFQNDMSNAGLISRCMIIDNEDVDSEDKAVLNSNPVAPLIRDLVPDVCKKSVSDVAHVSLRLVMLCLTFIYYLMYSNNEWY
jgi:hypothetical protein